MSVDPLTKHTDRPSQGSRLPVVSEPGSGKWYVNGRTLGDYFPRPALVSAIQQPFTATDYAGRFDVRAQASRAAACPDRPARSVWRSRARWCKWTRRTAGSCVISDC